MLFLLTRYEMSLPLEGGGWLPQAAGWGSICAALTPTRSASRSDLPLSGGGMPTGVTAIVHRGSCP